MAKKYKQTTLFDVPVKAHKRHDPRIEKKVDVKEYTRKQEVKEFKKTTKPIAKPISKKKDYQERYLIVAKFLGKKPDEMKTHEYMGFIGIVSGEYEKSGRDKATTDQEDFTNFIREYMLSIDDKVFADQTIINLQGTLEMLENGLVRVKKKVKQGEVRGLPEETMDKLIFDVQDYEKGIKEAKDQIEKRTNHLRGKYAKKTIKIKKIKSEYLLDNRPADIGTIPDPKKVIKSENWKPTKANNFTFGSVQYPDKLTFEQIYKYELRPKNDVEYANYMFWLKNDKDHEKAERTKKRYLKLSMEELEEWRGRDPFSNYAYLIKTNMKKEKKYYSHTDFENARHNVIQLKDEIKYDTIDRDKAIKQGESEGRINFLDKKLDEKKEDLKQAIKDRDNIEKLPRKSKPKKEKKPEIKPKPKPKPAKAKKSIAEDDEYAKYYEKTMKKNDKISQPKLKKFQEEIEELERKGDRNARFDIALQYPKENQKELVKQYKKTLKRYTLIHSRDYDLKLQKKFKAIKNLPDLKGKQKYYIVMVRESGWVDHIAYKTKREDAIDELQINDILYKNLRKDEKGKVELIIGNNINEIRDKVRSRGREHYLITGDTYKQKGKIRSIGRVKFDYGKKGYIGELSPKELKQMKELTGIEVKKVEPLTKKDIDASKVAKAHSKSQKYVRHKRVKGSIWQKENPFTKQQNELEHSLTWIFKIGDDRNRLNTDFNKYVKPKEQKIIQDLNLKSITDAPEDVQNAYDRYRKAVYNKMLSDLNATRIAPSMAITGASGYKGNIPKRERIERNAYERFKRVDTQVDKVIKQYKNL